MKSVWSCKVVFRISWLGMRIWQHDRNGVLGTQPSASRIPAVGWWQGCKLGSPQHFPVNPYHIPFHIQYSKQYQSYWTLSQYLFRLRIWNISLEYDFHNLENGMMVSCSFISLMEIYWCFLLFHCISKICPFVVGWLNGIIPCAFELFSIQAIRKIPDSDMPVNIP